MGQAKQRGTFEERKAASIQNRALIVLNKVERREKETDKEMDKRWYTLVRGCPANLKSTYEKCIKWYIETVVKKDEVKKPYVYSITDLIPAK